MGLPELARFRQNKIASIKEIPLAPEDDEFSAEIRQMIVGRYRILFTIRKQKVHVLHIRGAYPAK